jgi:hypothetical protein
MAYFHAPLRDSLKKLEPKEFAGELRQNIAAHLISEAPLLQSDEINVKIGELELIAQAKYPSLTDALYYDAATNAKRIKREYKQAMRKALAKNLFVTTDEAEKQRINDYIKQLDKEIEALKR